jgi:uncharacterized protein RhaS with RHS repeats
MGARYYNPVLGRFMGVDPVGYSETNIHSHNRYTYANNNPYKFVDPDGREAEGIVGEKEAKEYQDASKPYVDSTVPGKIAAVFGLRAVNSVLGGLVNAEKAAAITAVDNARKARDALSAELSILGSKAPATVTAGVNTKTGQVAASACGGGKCAEDHVAKALGNNKNEIQFTETTRPRTGKEVPVCGNCESTYGRSMFPAGTTFKSDLIK